MPDRVYFRGLNSLRFFAAMFVLVDHLPMTQASVGLPHWTWGASFFRGEPAVCFFFTLSGFLITYLLLEERRRTGTISVRRFYVRRILRIWPLYFLISAFGLAFYRLFLPAIGQPYKAEYPTGLAILLYLLFLPNLMNSMFTVGGILNPLWSIGIEEQFYLTWAPLVRRAGARLGRLATTVFLVSLAVFVLNHFKVFGAGRTLYFVGQLKFHFMAVGALAALAVFNRREAVIGRWPFASRVGQLVMLALLLEYYLLGRIPWGWLGAEVVQVVLYVWLIVNTAANPRSIVPVGERWFDYPGVISYGVYMYHMVAVYATTWIFLHTTWWKPHLVAYELVFYLAAAGLTLLLAHASYQFFEKRFLTLKDRRFASLAAPLPHEATPPRRSFSIAADWTSDR